MLVSAIVSILLNLLAILILASVIISIIRGAPPVPSSKRVIGIVLELAGEQPIQKAVDLGAGDGRVVRQLARQGIETYGYEINPLLVWWGNWRGKKAGLSDKAFLRTGNMWKQNLQDFDFVVIYGLPNVMGHFEAKLDRELRPGARVVSNSFPLPAWKPLKKVENVYLYQKSGE